MEKINLGTRLSLWNKFILWTFWATHDPSDRRSWEEVKHGAIKHECKFEGKIIEHSRYHFQECTHYGCNTVNPID